MVIISAPMLDTTSQEPRILCHQDLHCIAAVGVNATQDLAEMLLFNRPLGIDGIVSVLSRIVELEHACFRYELTSTYTSSGSRLRQTVSDGTGKWFACKPNP